MEEIGGRGQLAAGGKDELAKHHLATLAKKHEGLPVRKASEGGGKFCAPLLRFRLTEQNLLHPLPFIKLRLPAATAKAPFPS